MNKVENKFNNLNKCIISFDWYKVNGGLTNSWILDKDDCEL